MSSLKIKLTQSNLTAIAMKTCQFEGQVNKLSNIYEPSEYYQLFEVA